MHNVGDVAKLSGVSVRMLRHYDDIGLFKPACVDPRTSYRHYEPSQLARLHRILALKDLGFTLAQLRTIVAEEVSAGELRGMLRLRRAEVEAEIAGAQDRLRRVEHHIQRIEKELQMPNTVPADAFTMKRIEAMTIAELSARSDGFGPDIGKVLPPLYPALFERMERNGLVPVAAPIAYYDDAADGDGIIVHAGAPIRPPSGEVDGVSIVELPAIEHAVTVIHHGSMDNVEDTYMAALEWIADRGLRTVGYSREVYLDCPEDQSKWVTELQYAVAPQ